MNVEIGLHPDELPIADWLNSRMNQPPPGAAWKPGGSALVTSRAFMFDPELAPVLVDLLELYADTSDVDPDLNPEAVNAAMRLRDKIVEAVE
jgi:hypothetical protein